MQSEEQRLIDGLFSRLKTADTPSNPRDATVESYINQQLRAQPAAPYYMAQALIVQEAALKQCNDRINALEAEIARLQQPAAQPAEGRGGFLAGLFGAGRATAAPPAQESAWSRPSTPGNAPIPGITPTQGYAAPPQGYAPSNTAPSRTTSFLGGALQTAAGVAGGVVLADMLTGMFHHSQPEEIVNIINQAPPEYAADRGNSADDDAAWRDTAYDNRDDYAADDDVGNDFDDDSFM